MKESPNVLDVVVLTVAVLFFGRLCLTESGLQFLGYRQLLPLLLSSVYPHYAFSLTRSVLPEGGVGR